MKTPPSHRLRLELPISRLLPKARGAERRIKFPEDEPGRRRYIAYALCWREDSEPGLIYKALSPDGLYWESE